MHQDLKPDNILISRGESKSKYEFIPVLADFGYSRVKPVASQDVDPQVQDQHGNQEFGRWCPFNCYNFGFGNLLTLCMTAAPEVSHHAAHLLSGPSTITSKADIWAMGCIISVAAVWAVMGPDGIQEYAELRSQETGRSRNFENRTPCFHNGVRLLDAVKTMHNKVLHYCQHESATPSSGLIVTAKILKTVETCCLTEEPTDRMSARHVYERLCLDQPREPASTDGETRNVTPVVHLRATGTDEASQAKRRSIAESSKAASIHQPSVDSLRVPSSSQRPTFPRVASTGSVVPQINHVPEANSSVVPRINNVSEDDNRPVLHQRNEPLTLDQCRDWMEAKKSNQPIPDKQVDDKIRCIQKNLRDREYVFLMDDTRSMAKHRHEMKKAFDVLSYIAKPMDPNRVELIYASKPGHVYKLNNGFYLTFSGQWARVMKSFDECRFEHLTGLLESHLNRVIESIIKKQSTFWRDRIPTSLFIFTDGNWGVDPPHTSGVERCIQKLMDYSKERQERTFVMVQFIRFGNDAQGIRHLDFLDRFGTQEDWYGLVTLSSHFPLHAHC